MWQPLARWRSWHLSMEEPGGCMWGKNWLPSTVPAGRAWEGWQTQCVHWLVLPSCCTCFWVVHPANTWTGREGELAAPGPSMEQAQKKWLWSELCLPVPPTCFFLRVFRKGYQTKRTETHLKRASAKGGVRLNSCVAIITRTQLGFLKQPIRELRQDVDDSAASFPCAFSWRMSSSICRNGATGSSWV